ncbi:MAG: hypothetical protein HRU19_05930 [Pseudobacteriovorax sp.]|nr:hypothetical protein [Pseudobacteriovorax sp.]
MKKAIILAISLISANAFADKNTGKIATIHTYSYGIAAGDTIVGLTRASGGCPNGYFLSSSYASEDAKKAILSKLLFAKAQGLEVKIDGKEDLKWAGSTAKYCTIYNLSIP